jgi:hypothetical protein
LTLSAYDVTRSVTRGLKGKRIHFQLTSDADVPLLHAKTKTNNPRLIQIANGREMHFSDAEFEGAILTAEDLSAYSVRRGSQYGDELATIKFTRRICTNKKQQKEPRSLRVTFFVRPDGFPPSIASRRSRQCSLEDRGSQNTVRNATLVDSTDKEVVVVLSTGDEVLRIYASDAISLLVVFGIGIASFLCKIQ